MALSTAIVRAPALALTGPGAWWRPSRRALVLDAYRILVGGLLCAHFAALLRELPGVVDLYGPDGAKLTELPFVPDSSMLALGLAGCVALALAIVLGVAPRICAAALFVISVFVHRIGLPVSSLDDHLVCVALFWLCMLPVGRTLTIVRFGDWQAWSAQRVEGWSTGSFALHLLLLHFDVELWRSFALRWPHGPFAAIAFCGVAAGLLAPSRAVRLAAILGLVSLHGLLRGQTGLTFAHGLMAVSALLFWGEQETADARFAIGAPSMLGAVVVLLSALYLITSRTGPRPVRASVARALWDAGLLPTGSGQHVSEAALGLRFEPDREGAAATELRGSDFAPGARVELLLRYLASGRDEHRELRTSIASSAVERYCRGRGAAGEAGVLGLHSVQRRIDVAWYECGAADALPRVVVLDQAAAHGASK